MVDPQRSPRDFDRAGLNDAMIRYFLTSLGSHYRSGRTLFFLALFGVALGVASVLSIQIINRNALGAFEGSMRAVSGDADLTVLGTTGAFDETLFEKVLADEDVARAWPMVRTEVAVAGREQYYLEIVGVDLFAPLTLPWAQSDASAREIEPPTGSVADLGEALDVPGWVAITPELARELGVARGDAIDVSIGTRSVELRVGALVDFREVAPLASRKLTVMDIAQAQDLLVGSGRIDQIDIVLRDGADEPDASKRLAAALGPGVRVRTPEQRRSDAAGLMSAFRLNLTALSLVSLFVGAFLVYASTQAALVRRRGEFGLLRAIGASRGQVLGLVVGEIAVLAVLGTAIGLPLGYAVASLNVEVVSATLTNLYLLHEIERLTLPLSIWVLGVAIGLLGAFLGAAWPAWDLVRRHPRELLAAYTLHERVGAASTKLLAIGLATVVLTLVWFVVGGHRMRPAGFVLGVSLLVAVPLAAPWVVRRLAGSGTVRSFSFAFGLRTLKQRVQTAFVAVAALSVAVSMLVAITIMIGSFRRTVEVWLDTVTVADVYISTDSWRRARDDASFDARWIDRLRSMEGVRAVDTLRQFMGYSGDRRISIAGFDVAASGNDRAFMLYEGDPRESIAAVRDRGAVWISEPLARKADVWVGDRIPLAGPEGVISLPVAGVSYDYSSEMGGVLMDLATLERHFGPGPMQNVALYLEPGVDPERTVDRVRAMFPEAPLDVRSNETLRREVFAIFDQTFAITELLRAMSLLIAVCGVTLTLLVLARERVGELALYRALGARRDQIFRVFVGKGLGMAAFGLLLGAVGGVALAMVLVLVINRAYFGWTIALHWPVVDLVEQALTIVLAACVASLYPAFRASRTPATELSRDDL